jgi:class 3 adenylate cyclase/TolB-like protein
MEASPLRVTAAGPAGIVALLAGSRQLAEERVERRLAAILCADVVGYSRLMGADEERTLAALKSHRRELIDPLIGQHRGRILKTTGDGMLIEFASVVDAVRCAVVVQRGMEDRNANLPEAERIRLRIGINLGDVMVDEGDMFGDGVNVAARIEALAAPGEICVSYSVREQVGEKLPVRFTDLGEHGVKNIARPVRVYRVEKGAEPYAGPTEAKTQDRLGLADRPSLAVMPFANMSGDAEQEYFVDGIVEDIITGLSRLRWLHVVARNSTFAYKGRAVDLKQVGRELGVRYVLEGSMRKAGNRVRVTVQLIAAASGTHVWAERYDRALDDNRIAGRHHLERGRRDRAEPALRRDRAGQAQAPRQPRRLRSLFARAAASSRVNAERCGQGFGAASPGARASAGLSGCPCRGGSGS